METERTEVQYSRWGSIAFVVIMAFPFVALGVDLAKTSPAAFLLYAGMVAVTAVAALIALKFAPTISESRQRPAAEIEELDTRTYGVPW